jgi:hypothetical protein
VYNSVLFKIKQNKIDNTAIRRLQRRVECLISCAGTTSHFKILNGVFKVYATSAPHLLPRDVWGGQLDKEGMEAPGRRGP